MKRIFVVLITFSIALSIYSCTKKEVPKPFGAETIDYDKVEGINKDGPLVESVHIENAPPIADKTVIIENGPEKLEMPDIKVEPTADMDLEPDFGGIPVVKKIN